MQSVKGEVEDIIPASLRDAKTLQKRKKKRHHEKKSCFNPYSKFGLDKFARLSAELSAKREYISRKTGTREAMVRFAYTSKGWVPVVVKNGYDGGSFKLSSLPPLRTKQESQCKENYNSNPQDKSGDDDDDVKDDEGCENDVNGSASKKEGVAVTILPWWSGYLKTAVFVVKKVSAIVISKFAVPAAAMAVVVLVGSLQMMCLGGVMGMKRFIDTEIFYFSELLVYLKTSPDFRTRSPEEAEQVEKPLASPEHKMSNEERLPEGSLVSLSALSSPAVFSASHNSSRSQDSNIQRKGKKKKNKFGRIFSIDGQPRKTIRLQQSESFLGRAGKRAIDTTVGATLMAIILFVLVIYGRLCAICFTSALLCVVSKLRNDEYSNASGTNYNNSRVMMDLRSREYRKKVIMDGLLDRSHGRATQHSQMI